MGGTGAIMVAELVHCTDDGMGLDESPDLLYPYVLARVH